MVRTDAESELVIRLLGDPDVRRGQRRIELLDSPRLRSLLAYVIVGRERPISRQRLALTFWPASTEAQARTNLRQALHHLKRALGDVDRYVRLDGASVQWRADGPAQVDLVRFEDAASGGLRDVDSEALERAAAEYRGDLLVGHYDDWLAPERDRLRSLASSVLHTLASMATERREWARAVDLAERLLRLDPLDESAHRLAIDTHAAAGDRLRAVRRYHECVTVLERELGVVPDAATVARYDALVTAASADPGGARPGSTAHRAGLIGRDQELGLLLDAWRDTAGGQSQFVLVAGEPGIGKSRLVEELVARCARDGAATVTARAYEADGDRPYGPINEILRADAMRVSVDALHPELRRELARVLPGSDTIVAAAGRLAEQDERHRMFEAIGRVLVGPSRRVVLVVDDLHWCDPDTVDLLEFILRTAAAAGSGLLVVGTVRSAELASHPGLRGGIARLHAAAGRAGDLALDRLDAAASRELLRLVGDPATAALADQVVTAADGNPLFLMEMARSGITVRSDGTLELPALLQAAIDTRLDRLTDASRELVSVASVVGRSFTIDLLTHLVRDQHMAVAAIDELWRCGIVRARGANSYDFSHDRIRDVAYHRIGPAQRRAHHDAIARALQELDSCEPAQVAYHLEHAGAVDASIDAYRCAVDEAARAFAHQDVIRNCRRALRLVATRPPGSQRDESEIAFLVPLGVALLAGPGITEGDSGVYERARALHRQRGLDVDPSTLRLSASAAIAQRNYLHARRFGDTLLQRGLHERDPVLITEGHYLLGVTSFWLADLRTSRFHLEQALASHQARHTPLHLERFGQDPQAVCLVRLALTCYHLDDDATAAINLADALEVSAELNHEYTDVYVRTFAAWYLAESGRADAAADVVNGMPRTTQNPMALIANAQFNGWAATERGDLNGGTGLLLSAHHISVRHGQRMFEPYALMLLARSRLSAGDFAAALTDAVAALSIATTEMPFHIPEARRLTCELRLAIGDDPPRAVAGLEEAAAEASRAGAVIHEQRARASLRAMARMDALASDAELS